MSTPITWRPLPTRAASASSKSPVRCLQVEDGDQHLRLCDRRAYRGRIDGEYECARLGSFAVAHTRLGEPRPADAGHDLAFRKMAVGHDALLARLGLEIAMLARNSATSLRPPGQQRTRAAAQGSL